MCWTAEAGFHRRQLADGRPIELLTAVCDQREEAVAQEACERHRHAQVFSGRKRETLDAWFGDEARARVRAVLERIGKKP